MTYKLGGSGESGPFLLSSWGKHWGDQQFAFFKIESATGCNLHRLTADDGFGVNSEAIY